MHDQRHAGRVDDALVVGDVGVVAGDGAQALQEQAVAELHDVGLVNAGDALPAVGAGELEREPRDVRRRLLGDDLEALDDAGHDLVLDPGVEVFGVLANDDQVDALEPAGNAGDVLDRPKIGVETQRLAQPDVDAGEPFADRRRHRSLQRDLVAFDRFEQLGRQRDIVPLKRRHAGVVRLPRDCEPGHLEDAHDRFRDFGTDAVSRDEGDGVHKIFGRGSGLGVRGSGFGTRLQAGGVSDLARSAATASSSSRSSAVNAASLSLSMSISPRTSAPFMIGTTISDLVSTLQAR